MVAHATVAPPTIRLRRSKLALPATAELPRRIDDVYAVHSVPTAAPPRSYSLNRHLQRTYDMSSGVPFGGDGYVEVVANSLVGGRQPVALDLGAGCRGSSCAMAVLQSQVYCTHPQHACPPTEFVDGMRNSTQVRQLGCKKLLMLTLPPSRPQSPDTQMPVTGTAAAVRQFMTYFDSNTKNRFIEDVLVLPGDHVYNADLTPVVAYHRTTVRGQCYGVTVYSLKEQQFHQRQPLICAEVMQQETTSMLSCAVDCFWVARCYRLPTGVLCSTIAHACCDITH